MSGNFVVKSFEQTRTDYLRTYRELMIRLGVEDPDVSPGTSIYVHATGLAQECAALGYNLAILAQDVLPDTAQGDQLIRHGKLVRRTLRPPGVSDGTIVLASSVSPIAVVTGAPLIDAAGLKYKASVGGSYSNGDLVPCESVDTGAATNLAEGTLLRWTTPPAFATQTVAVGPGGLTGGANVEDVEGLRVRVLDAWASPEDGANASQLSGWTEESSPSVQKAFVYPCYNGPGTVAIVVVRAPTASDKHRAIGALVLSTTIAPFVLGEVPEFVEVSLTTVAEEATSASFGLALPDFATGRGWANETPWPTYAANGYADVTAVTSSTVFTVHADAPPEPGVTQICWLAPDVGSSASWKIFKATVVSYVGAGPTWTVTVDTPFVDLGAGHWISPLAVNIDSYFAAVLSQFANLGPGEKTIVAGLLPRALRRPLPSQSWPSSIGPTILKFISQVGDEVLDVDYLYRSQTSPTVPASASQAPNILIPASVGFYPLAV